MSVVVAVAGWLAGLGLIFTGGPQPWILVSVAAAAACTAVYGTCLASRGAVGAFELGYRVGVRDGKAIARHNGAGGQVITLRR